MFVLNQTDEVKRLIAITKSDSGISGAKLREAHRRLGHLIGEAFASLNPADTTVVAMLRGGIFFAEGIASAMDCRMDMYNPKYETFVRPATKNVILADSVINTGKTVVEIYAPDMMVACCVINEKAVPLFRDNLYAVRVSSNSFVGAAQKTQTGTKGPDTTMRLFNQI